MSFDLAVWHSRGPMTEDAALEKYDFLASRPTDDIIPDSDIVFFIEEVVRQFRELRILDETEEPWAVAPGLGEDYAIMAIRSPLSREVAAIVKTVAADYGLTVFDPQATSSGGVGSDEGLPVTLELQSGEVVVSPSRIAIAQKLNGISVSNWYAILRTAPQTYIQVGFGDETAAPKDSYIVEYRAGSADQHWRTTVTTVREVVSAFLGFEKGGSGLVSEFTWSQVKDL